MNIEGTHLIFLCFLCKKISWKKYRLIILVQYSNLKAIQTKAFGKIETSTMNENPMTTQARFIKLSLLILFTIPSTICTLYVIYNFIKNPSFRKRFQNQTLIILVFIVLFNIIFNIPTTLR